MNSNSNISESVENENIIKRHQNRCPAYTDTERKCRTKLNGNRLFCCKKHEPINREIIDQGCFICQEIIYNTNEIIFFNCNHAFHKPCYYEWLEYSTYETPICILCRNDNILNFLKAVKKKKELKSLYCKKSYTIQNILFNSISDKNINIEKYKINYGNKLI